MLSFIVKLIKFFLWFGLLFILLIVIWLLFIKFRSASNEGNWQTQFKVLPEVEIDGDIISIENVRDFRYKQDETIKEANYLNKQYRLSALKDIWYGISHFGDNGLAHVFISFEFATEESYNTDSNFSDYLVVSIEARLQEKNKGYNPLTGLFGFYNKTIVLSTEQDVIGLRTHIRKEPVDFYRLTISSLNERNLLLNFLWNVNSLHTKPELYNSILDNCMTGLLAQSKFFDGKPVWLDKRILFPGNSDAVAYELDFINTEIPFADLKENARIDPSITDIESANFSLALRMGK